MNKIKKFFKNLIISFLIFYIVIANTSSSYARNFDDAARAFLAEQTEQFIEKHKGDSVYSTSVLPASFIGTTFHSCCTSGIGYVYKEFLGISIYDLGYSDGAAQNLTTLKEKPQYWTEVSFSESKPGDILITSAHGGHAEMVREAGNVSHFNFGSGRTNANLNTHPSRPGEFQKVFSLNEDVQVTPSGSLPDVDNELEEDNLTEDPEDEFYYQGIPQEGSFAGSSTFSLGKLLNWLFNLISQLIDFLLGFMTMIIKMVVVGYANIFVNIVTDAVDAITGEAVDTNSPQAGSIAEDAANTTTNTTGDNVNTFDDQDILDSDDLYTPSSTELQPEGDDKLTVDKIIFNLVPLLDVNVFTDSAGGYTLKDNSSLKLIRENLASWYYIIRNLAIVIMLVILIYIGIKMAISSVASEKAEYKRMLLNWAVGFLIIFIIHYYMMLILGLNEGLVKTIYHSQTVLGYEDSIYETIRTKAYEIKFSSGMLGTILYIILVFLMLKFFYIYIKRFLAVCILTVMAPVMGASYAISKVRTGKAKAFTQWMKDYTLIVLIQSAHALIYTCFVTVVLQLTDQSFAGIILSLIVMNFMLKATDIFTSIFSMVGDGKRGSHNTLGSLLGSDPQREIVEKAVVGGTIARGIFNAGKGAIQFGKDFAEAPGTLKRSKQLAQAQGLGLGNLGKGAIGYTWLGIKNINASTGQFVAKGRPEILASLSNDLKNAQEATKQDRKNSRKKFRSDLISTQTGAYNDAFKLATGIPLMGISGMAGMGAANLFSGATGMMKRRRIRNAKRNGKPYRFSSPVRMATRLAGGPITAGIVTGKEAIEGGIKQGGKIQDTYESRMNLINQAKASEAEVIDLYTSGRRDKEAEIRADGTGKSEKVVASVAKTAYDESYRKTIANVFEVSDIVDKGVDTANSNSQIRDYKARTGVGESVLGKESIENITGQIQERATNNIAEKVRARYQPDPNIALDAVTEQRVREETEQRVAEFMEELTKEINDRVEVTATDPTVIKGQELDFSESIKADTLKSTIEDVMRKHNAEKKAEKGMERMQEAMQRLQRQDRDYANLEENREHTYLYKFGSDIRLQQEKRSNLKNVLSSLTFRNIDINGEGE